MKIIIGSVVKGFQLKEKIKKYLENQGHEVFDVGCYNTEKFVKYTSVGERIAKALKDKKGELAIMCCGTGTGASLSAGKFKGVLACSCESVYTAKMSRVINGANCLCLGETSVDEKLALEIVDVFINSKFLDSPGTPKEILNFWKEAHEEMIKKGDIPIERELETI